MRVSAGGRPVSVALAVRAADAQVFGKRDVTTGEDGACEFKARQCNTVLVIHLPPLADERQWIKRVRPPTWLY